MLIVEYRVMLPMTVEEYQVAQLYMILKKSRQESSGPGSGIEILDNSPYTDGPNGSSGQYTRKHYHLNAHLPDWMRRFLPNAVIEEEAWNAYPYTKTLFRAHEAPQYLKAAFSLEIETRYCNDTGTQHNVFGLGKEDLARREVCLIDMIKDCDKADYVPEEDPLLFKSEKTGRGPLTEDWIAQRVGRPDILCAYKLCRIRFERWGFETKVEQFVHTRALKRTLCRAHRQAWCWQDEYHGLSMADIRRLERTVQTELSTRMGGGGGGGRDPEDGPGVDGVVPGGGGDHADNDRADEGSERCSSGRLSSDEEQEEDEDEDDEFYDAVSHRTASFASLDEPYEPLAASGRSDSVPLSSVTHVLVVVHGGNVLLTDPQIDSDFNTFSRSFRSVAHKFFPASAADTTHLKLLSVVSESQLVPGVYRRLCELHPLSASRDELFRSWFPVSAASLLLPSQPEYRDVLADLGRQLNAYIREVTDANPAIAHNISIVCDNIGSILVHDLLTQMTSTTALDFVPSRVFYLGSSLAYLLSQRADPAPPACPLYNVFYPEDPGCCRVEPVFDQTAASREPCPVPKFDQLTFSEVNMHAQLPRALPGATGRVDFQLAPSYDISTINPHALPCFFHSCYWESYDVMYLILSQSSPSGPTQPCVDHLDHLLTRKETHQWRGRTTSYKIRNLVPVHVAHDVMVTRDRETPVTLTGRFQYGLLGLVKLKNENVEVFVGQNSGELQSLGLAMTSSSGRLAFEYENVEELGFGIHPLKMFVIGDGSSASANLCVLPSSGVQAVIFSIDGTFAASRSISGATPKLRPHSIQLVKYWCGLGYFIIYATARPIVQKPAVLQWMEANNFPASFYLFVDGMDKRNLSRKREALSSIMRQCNLTVHAAYGAPRDIPSYQALDVPHNRTFIIGNPKKRTTGVGGSSSGYINPNSGFAGHIENLKTDQKLGCFAPARNPLNFSMQTALRLKTQMQEKESRFGASNMFYMSMRSSQDTLRSNASEKLNYSL